MRRMFSEKQIREFSAEEAKSVKKDIATLVDADGHERFIEGDLVLEEVSGLTKTYGKWSLSGSHLMIVLAIDIANGTSISSSTDLSSITFPQWLIDKIYPLFANTVVDFKSFTARSDDYSAKSYSSFINKQSNKLNIVSGSFTADKDYHVRLEFDLLIDNE